MSTERLTAEELAEIEVRVKEVPAIYYCTQGVYCKWQGFGMLLGVGSGLIEKTTSEWRRRHELRCPGQLIQLTPNKDVPALLRHIRTLEGRESALRAALEPFGNGTVARHIEEGDRTENSQKYAIMQDRIKDWLGCSDFRRARAALAGEPSGVHTPPGCVSVPVEVAGDALFLARLLRKKHPTLKTDALTERTINALSEIVPTGMAYDEAVEAHRALDALAGDAGKGNQ